MEPRDPESIRRALRGMTREQLLEIVDSSDRLYPPETRRVAEQLLAGEEWSLDERPAGPKPGKPVVLTDVQMPFGAMVGLMVRWALASIPALLILGLVGAVIAAVLGGVLGGLR